MISGTLQQGATLAASKGGWTNNPTGYAYQWKRCDSAGSNCVAIGGSTGSQNTLGAAAVGKTLRVTVTASNAGGSGSATSSATGIVRAAPTPAPPPPPASTLPVNTALPVITGSPQQGVTLSASTGSWTNTPTSYAFQWSRCDAAGDNCVSMASRGPQNTLGRAGVGKTLRMTVTASNASGSSSATSNATPVIAPAPAPTPQVSVRPEITGVPQEGLVLSTSAGTWSNAPKLYGYQWRRCSSGGGSCDSIAGATGPTYTVASVDVGSTLRVVVAAWNDAGVTYTRADATAVVAPRPARLPPRSPAPHRGSGSTPD